MNMKQSELRQLAFFHYKLFVARLLLLEPEQFFNVFDKYINNDELTEKQISQIRLLEGRKPNEIKGIITKEIKEFISGAYASSISDPLLLRYSYHYQRNNFIDKVNKYLKRYNKKVPLDPSEDSQLFGENPNKITFLETLIALEHEGLIEIIKLQLKPVQTDTPLSFRAKMDPIFSPDQAKRLLSMLPQVTVKPTKKLINLIQPNLSYSHNRLSFKGKEIPITGKDQQSLCMVLLKNKKSMSKLWSWDQVVEEWGDRPEDIGWRKIYNAGREINIKVALETTIDDLLEVTTKSVRVNPTYLSFQAK